MTTTRHDAVLVVATILLAGLSVPVLAEEGRIGGNLGGVPFDFEIRDHIDGLTGIDFRTLTTSGGAASVSFTLEALQETGNRVEGVVIHVEFASVEDFVAGTVRDGEIMVIEEWPAGSPDPTRVWLAEADRFESVVFDAARIDGDTGAIARQITSQRFCLHEFDGFDPVPVRRDMAMICQSGAVSFAAASDGAAAPPARAPIEVEVLGRIEGMIGLDSHSWVTILSRNGDATATLGELPGGTEILRLQGHSPSSPDFRRQQVLGVTLVGDPATGLIARDAAVPAEVSFFPGIDSAYYTSGGEGGSAEARVLQLYLDDEGGAALLEIEGRLCRVDGLEEVAGRCRSFDLLVRTQILRDADG
ncbi:MAG: hypothetical protein ACXIUV_09785 [Alkalilacustris sp.]